MTTITDQELLTQGWKYGRDIPHLVDPQDYDKMYDPDAIESMQMMYDLTDEEIAKTDNDEYGKAFLRLQTKGFQERKASQSLTAQDHQDIKTYENLCDPDAIEAIKDIKAGAYDSEDGTTAKERIAQFYAQFQPKPTTKPARKSISLRMFADDIDKLKAKAQKLGMPYQTYIISELHKLANS